MKDRPPLKLRWRFHYANDRAPAACAWDSAREGEASFTTKDQLRCAAIETMDHMGHMRRIAECDGHDFINFEWIAQERRGLDGARRTCLVGIKMRTRDMVTDVYKDGEIFARPMSTDDKKIHYAGFGR